MKGYFGDGSFRAPAITHGDDAVRRLAKELAHTWTQWAAIDRAIRRAALEMGWVKPKPKVKIRIKRRS